MELRMTLPPQVKIYCSDLAAFIGSPAQVYMLGACGILRNLLDDYSAAIEENKSAASDDERETLLEIGKELAEIRKKISIPLHYQGVYGYDFFSGEADRLRANPLSRSTDKAVRTMTLGGLFIHCLDAFLSAVRKLGPFIAREHRNDCDELIRAADDALKPGTGVYAKLEGFTCVWPQEKQTTRFNTFIGSLASVIRDTDRSRGEKSRIQLMSTALACRVIAEAFGHYMIDRYAGDAEKAKEQKGAAGKGGGLCQNYSRRSLSNAAVEMEDYLQSLEGCRKYISQMDDRNRLSTDIAMMRLIGEYANGLADEADKKKNGDGLRGADRFPEGAKQKEFLQKLITPTVSLMEKLTTDHIPESVEYLLKNFHGEIRKLRRRIRCQKVLLRFGLIPCVIGLFAVLCLVTWNHEYVSCYLDYVWADGQPVGIYQTDGGENGQDCYRFTVKGKIPLISGGYVYRVEHIDHTGKIRNETRTDRLDRPAEIVFDMPGIAAGKVNINASYYDENGELLCYTELSRDGTLMRYSHPDTGLEMMLPYDMTAFDVYTWKDQSTGAGKNFEKNTSEMSFRRITRDAGRESVVSFRMDDHVYTDGNGIESIRYTYDEQGRIIAEDYSYDPYLLMGASSGSLEQYGRASVLREDRPVRKEYVYDGYALSGTAVLRHNGGITERSYTYDARGSCISETCSDPASGSVTVHCREYDEATGDLLAERWLDGENRGVLNADGVSAIMYTYENGRMTGIRRYDEKNELLGTDWAEHVWEHTADGDKLYTKEYYLNNAGLMLRMNMDYVYTITEQTDHGTLVSYYDAGGEPMMHRMGYYQYRETAEKDTVIREYLDAEGKPVNNAEGYARGEDRYRGSLLISSAVYDRNGNPVNVNGVSRTENKYNAKRQIEERKLTSATGIYPSGYNRVVYRYDAANGRLLSHAYYLDDTPVMSYEDGYARVVYAYDDAENEKSWTYYNENGEPIIREKVGYSRILQTEDEQGNVIAEYYYDQYGAPLYVAGRGYCAAFDRDRHTVTYRLKVAAAETRDAVFKRVTYSDRNLKTKEEWLDSAYEPALGRAALIYQYASADGGEYIPGQPYAATILSTDDAGQLVTDPDWGAVGCIAGYNEKDQIADLRYFDENGNITVSETLGYAGYDNTFDAFDRVTRTVYVDAQGQPVERPDEGYASVAYEYDIRGNLVIRRYFDREGKPAVNRALGYAAIEWAYNARNEAAEERTYDEHGNPVIRHDLAVINESYGFASDMYYTTIRNGVLTAETVDEGTEKLPDTLAARVTAWFPQGLFTARTDTEMTVDMVSYYDFDGRTEELDIFSVLTQQGEMEGTSLPNVPYFISDPVGAGVDYCFMYNDDMRLAWTGFRDSSGDFTRFNGYAFCERFYDTRGGRMLMAFLDENEQLTSPALQGYAAVYTMTDEQGRVVTRAYFGADGKMTVCPQTGYAMCSITYNDAGRVRSVSYFTDDTSYIEYVSGKWNWEFSEDRDLSFNQKTGYARAVYEYDGNGRRTGTVYYGADGELCDIPAGYSSVMITYNDETAGNEAAGGYASDLKDISFMTADGDARITRFIRVTAPEEGMIVLTGSAGSDDPQDEGDAGSGIAAEGIMVSYKDGKPGTVNEVQLTEESVLLRSDPVPDRCYLLAQSEGIDGHVYEQIWYVRDEAGNGYFLAADYDGSMNMTCVSCYDQQWEPAYYPAMGCSSFCCLYDENNQLIGQYYLDTKQQFMRNTLTNDIARAYLYTEDGERLAYAIDEKGVCTLVETQGALRSPPGPLRNRSFSLEELIHETSATGGRE